MKKVVLFIFILLVNIQLNAQEKTLDSLKEKIKQVNYDYTQLYKENSDMSYTSPSGEIGAPSGYVINGRLTTTFMVFAPRNLPISFSLNPDYTVRVRTDRSAGVRTPSFRFGGTVYVRLVETLKNYKYTQLSFTHHSNGQDEDAILPNGTINTKTGNFNTNYLTVNYVFGNYIKQNNVGKVFYSFNHKIGLELHKLFNYEPALIGDYGFTRLNYDFSFRVYQTYAGNRGLKKISASNPLSTNSVEKETWRFNGLVSYAVNQYQNQALFSAKRRLNIEASANYSLPFMQNVFMMASFGYYGEDPYNIYFKDRYAYMRFGLSSTFSRYKIK